MPCRSSCNAASILPSGSSFDKTYLMMEKNFGNFSSANHLTRLKGPGIRENKLKGKGADAVGATIAVDCRAEAFNRESSDDMQVQGRIISTTRGVNPRAEKIESLLSTKPTIGTRRSSRKNKSKSGSAPLKKLRKRKASVLTRHHLNDKPSDIAGEMDDDHKELLMAAGSVHSARENASSSPFWKTMESFFAPVTSQDLLLLEEQLDPAEDQTQSQMFGDECDAAGVIPKSCIRREVSNWDKGSVKSTDFGSSNKTSNVVPPLLQRLLSALIDEDGCEETSTTDEGRRISFQCMNDDLYLGSRGYTGYDARSGDSVEIEVVAEVDLQTQKSLPVDRVSCNRSASSNTNSKGSVSSTFSNHKQQSADDGWSYSNAGNFHGNYQNDPILIHKSQVNSPSVSPFNCQYQIPFLDDKLLLELQSIGLNVPLLDDREEGIDQEIKGLKEDLYQQVSKVKNSLRKIEKAVKCEQDLEKRNLKASAMDQLVEMAYKRMFQGGRPSKSARIRKISKQVSLAFVKRTLARCKQFEDSGRSCFSQPNLLDIISRKPPIEKDVRPTDCDGLMLSNNKCKQARDKAKCKGSENGPALGVIERLDSLIDNLHRAPSGLEQQSGHGIIYSKWNKEFLSHVDGGASSKATEFIGVTNPNQACTGFSGGVHPLSHPLASPSGLFSTYDHTSINGNMKLLGESASCSSSKAKFAGRHGRIKGVRGVKNRDEKTAGVARSAPRGVCKLKSKSKPKRPLSRIGLQDLSHPAQSLALKTNDQIANGNELPSPANAYHDASNETRLIKNGQLDALDPPKILGETEDVNSLLNFDEEGLSDGDCVGLEVPMDDLSEVDMFV